ncbi:MAG: electron transfer flavoprotein subunit beta/FixA family protein [Pseudomonadota bacterium]|nr:electron transfer flavoprotein subunit beta/FixA family protein [Pseudomonadota bacterium]
MKIFVCIKQVPDTETKIKIAEDKCGIDVSSVSKWIISPYDEYALEEAVKTKESNPGAKVIAICVGPAKRTQSTLRTSLAMGADEAIAIDAPDSLDTHLTALALAKAIKNEGGCDLVFCGKLAIDDNASAVTQQLAEFLDMPHATVVTKFENSAGISIITREGDGGNKELIELKSPAVLGASKGLNTPRFVSLPNIMKAKAKPLKEVTLASLDVSLEQRKISFFDFRPPPAKPSTKIVGGEAEQQVKELVRLLREESKVL